MRKEIARDLRTIFDATDLLEAERLVKLTAEKHTKTAPKLSQWIQSGVPLPGRHATAALATPSPAH